MKHLFAFSVSHDPGGAYTRMTPVPDQSVNIQANALVIPSQLTKLLGGAAYVGTLGAQVRLVAPSLRQIAPEHIAPVTLQISPTAEHVVAIDPNKIIELTASEQLEIEENSNPAAAEQHTVCIWLADKEILPVRGNIHSIGGTVTVTSVAGAWVNAVPALDEDLPPGRYSIVGLRVEAAGMIAVRVVVPGNAFRDGVLASATAGVNYHNRFRWGNFGEIAQFDTTTGFSLDLLASNAPGAATYRIIIDIIPA